MRTNSKEKTVVIHPTKNEEGKLVYDMTKHLSGGGSGGGPNASNDHKAEVKYNIVMARQEDIALIDELKKERAQLLVENEKLRQAEIDAQIELGKQDAEFQKLKGEYRTAHLERQHYKRIAEHRQEEFLALAARPAPGRLEIAALFLAQALEIKMSFQDALDAADGLIAASKEVQG